MHLTALISSRRPMWLTALAMSLLLHWVLLIGISADFKSPQPGSDQAMPPIRIALDYALPEPEPPPVTPDVLPDEIIEPTINETVTPSAPAVADSADIPDQQLPQPAAEPLPQTINADTLKRQLLASIRQPAQPAAQPEHQLPGNWTQDALPQSGVPKTQLLEPLTYTGPVTTERWKSDNGTPESRTVLADGTVICARGQTLLPNSNFEANLMLMQLCGKQKGGRENQNRLARYHGNSSDQSAEPDNGEEQ